MVVGPGLCVAEVQAEKGTLFVLFAIDSWAIDSLAVGMGQGHSGCWKMCWSSDGAGQWAVCCHSNAGGTGAGTL